jgi:hypothetical protein
MSEIWVFKKKKFKHIQKCSLGNWWGVLTLVIFFKHGFLSQCISVSCWVTFTSKKNFVIQLLLQCSPVSRIFPPDLRHVKNGYHWKVLLERYSIPSLPPFNILKKWFSSSQYKKWFSGRQYENGSVAHSIKNGSAAVSIKMGQRQTV